MMIDSDILSDDSEPVEQTLFDVQDLELTYYSSEVR